MKKILEFLNLHKILSIILAAVIFLVALWTPVIVILVKQQNAGNNSSLVDTQSIYSDANVYDGGTNSDSSKETTTDSQQTTTSVISSGTQMGSEVSSSSEIQSSSKAPSSSQQTTSEEKDPIAADAPRIICWGDSITVGMGMSRGEAYPGVLQKLVGNDYRVLNAGSSGEQSQTIAARQGAYEVTIDRDLVFKEGYGSVYLDGINGPNLVLEDGTILNINEDGESFRNDLPCKKVYIDGVEYELAANGKTIEILRKDYKKKLVIKKGTKIVLDSAINQKGSYCEIFYVSANDAGHREGDAEDIEYLINRYKAMAKRHGDDKYMVIIPQWAGGYTEPLKAEFGDRAVDLKAEICKRVIEKDGFPSTEKDIKEAKEGKIPTSLKHKNNPNDSLHLNADGYEMMANIIYDNGVKLGYWK